VGEGDGDPLSDELLGDGLGEGEGGGDVDEPVGEGDGDGDVLAGGLDEGEPDLQVGEAVTVGLPPGIGAPVP
jgi:hypothetical protein